jgi:hypothetical protein
MVVVVVGESHAECAAPGSQPQFQHSTQLAMNTSIILCDSYKDAQTHVSLETDYIAVQLQSEVAWHVCLDYVLSINRFRQRFATPTTNILEA